LKDDSNDNVNQEEIYLITSVGGETDPKGFRDDRKQRREVPLILSLLSHRMSKREKEVTKRGSRRRKHYKHEGGLKVFSIAEKEELLHSMMMFASDDDEGS
jgi:hypothetical protein